MKSSNNQKLKRGASPRVSEVLLLLTESGVIKQAGLAKQAGLNRGTLNQLFLGQTKATPKLIGRLCAVLDRESATRVLSAYLEEVSADVMEEQLEVAKKNVATPQLGDAVEMLPVSYPPPKRRERKVRTE